MIYARFAIYDLPFDGPLASFGAKWLGWDAQRGRKSQQFDLKGLGEVTKTASKYGFHGTLKPPFRLAENMTQSALENAVEQLAKTMEPVQCAGLRLATIGRFLALRPDGDTTALGQLAKACVVALDPFRAAPSPAELSRRRATGLSPRQERLLGQYGYPYVLEEFRFHLTLTGPLPKEDQQYWFDIAQQELGILPRPYQIRTIAFCGQRADGKFELIRRYPLGQ